MVPCLSSTSGLSLEEVGQRMKAEQTICTRMFLSMKAERLIRSFNCDAVYSQLVRIARSVLLSSWGERNEDLDERQHSRILELFSFLL